MLTDVNFPFVGLIAQSSDISDFSKQYFNLIAFQYGSTISQTSPSSILDWLLTFADIAGVAAIGLVVAVGFPEQTKQIFRVNRTLQVT
jgi:hypothetical protein